MNNDDLALAIKIRALTLGGRVAVYHDAEGTILLDPVGPTLGCKLLGIYTFDCPSEWIIQDIERAGLAVAA